MASPAVVVPILNRLIAPSSVLDVGCGSGMWLKEWAKLGLKPQNLLGIDQASMRSRLAISPNQFLICDLRTPARSWVQPRRFDLAMCLEVANHLPRRAARSLVEGLCAQANVIAFSAAVPGQEGGHLNPHWPSYWATLFAEHGYKPYDLVRDEIWWDQRVNWWYRQNLILFATAKAARARRWTSPPRSVDLAHPALLMPELRECVTATVCIPWRPTPSRLAAFDRVRKFWELFGWPVVTADSDTKVFSLAQARNNAVRQATTDVVVVSDADTVIDPLNVLRAVADPRGICWPFTKYRILSPDYLDTPVGELGNCPCLHAWEGKGITGVGGCLVCTTREFWRLGGQPPEFIGWGWEDVAFTLIVQTLSEARRLDGHVYAFEHNAHSETYVGSKADSPGWDRSYEGPNEQLFHNYQIAYGRPWLMRELIAKRELPLSEEPPMITAL